jgi:uncharacterized protein YneF (UPF0154 family)
MQYIVRIQNGKEYGPIDLPTLVEWVRQGRVGADTKVRNLGNGMLLMASNMPELDGMFLTNHARQTSAISSGYLYSGPGSLHQPSSDHWEDYKFVVLMSVVGLIFSVILGWLAVIFNVIAMKRAYEAAKEQKPMAGLGFSLALLSMIATLVIPLMMGFWLQRIIFPPSRSHNNSIGRNTDDK